MLFSEGEQNMIKILHVIASLGGGGVQKMLFNYYFGMDNSDITFDFVVHGEKEGILESSLIRAGSTVYHVTPKKTSFIKNVTDMYSVLKSKKYDAIVVHQNLSSFFSLALAFFCGIKTRIVHSHGYNPNEKKTFRKTVYRFLNRVFATDYAACSPEAALWLFGKKREKAKIVYNSINTTKFMYNVFKRKETRDKLNISDGDIMLLQVGRIVKDKNPLFSVNILKRLNDKKFLLVFVGNGDYETYVKDVALKYGMGNRVVFLGCVDNVEDYMNAADVLLFPSKHEGFGMVAVEAQMCGLAVLASDVIPRSTKISDNITYLSVESESSWVKCLCNMDFDKKRNNVYDERFDVLKQASEYKNYLINTVAERSRDRNK